MVTDVKPPAAGCPRILLIGAGRFGVEHLKEWMQLSAEGKAHLAGVVVRTRESACRVRGVFEGPVHVGLAPQLLSDIDGVDIVTPAATHYPLAKACLEHAGVLIEKPMTPDSRSSAELGRIARERGRVLMVGHIYRFHPMVHALGKFVAEARAMPRLITGRFSNPGDTHVEGLDARLEFLHLFDIIDLLFGVSPEFGSAVRRGHLDEVSLRYPGPMNVVLELGWEGKQKRREISLLFEDQRIDCDFPSNTIVVSRRGELIRTAYEGEPRPLRSELRAFSRLLQGEGDDRAVGADAGARIVAVAARTAAPMRANRPRVAVVGGGVFGTTCAIELGESCDVTLFERHAELMTEASYLNQWRHHSGFHYPRSPMTVMEIRQARDDFMNRYGSAVMRDFPSYFCTSARAQEITAERYLAICRSNGLSFEVVEPPADVLAPGSVSVCVKTDEGILDFHYLKRLIVGELAARRSVDVRLATEVVDGGFGADGSKRLVSVGPEGTRTEGFDFVINTTYANRNLVAKWFQFPLRPLRFDLLELLVMELDLRKVSTTVLDGPFTSLTTMGRDRLFMLSHIDQSVLRSVVTGDGAPPQWGAFSTNRANLIRAATDYFPAVARGRVVESRYGVRAVYAYSEDFDGRPTVVTEHGFGCWSVLGGKIITCVRNARDIASSIRRAAGGSDGWTRDRVQVERAATRDATAGT